MARGHHISGFEAEWGIEGGGRRAAAVVEKSQTFVNNGLPNGTKMTLRNGNSACFIILIQCLTMRQGVGQGSLVRALSMYALRNVDAAVDTSVYRSSQRGFSKGPPH